MVKLVSVAALALAAAPLAVHAVDNLKTDWVAYTSKLKIPDVIDATKGGAFEFKIARTAHNWTEDGTVSGDVYGYGLLNGTATFPGPTIKVKKGVPISVTWYNQLSLPHLLTESVEKTLTIEESRCYPYCGIPVVVHVHGLESPAKYDGLPTSSIYRNQSMEMVYLNNQSASTKLYHDHAQGMTRLNVWSGLAGLYVIEDAELDKKLNVDIETDIPLVFADRLINQKGELKYSDDNCKPAGTTLWVPESYGTVNTINGVVMPYVEIPNAQVRFRFANVANTRNYNFSIPFADKCSVIASDSGYVQTVKPLDAYVNMFPYERMEVVCDFSNDADGTKYEMIDIPTVEQDTPYDGRLLELRVKSSLKTATMTKKTIPETLVKYKDLKALFNELGGKMRSLTLGEIEYDVACPLQGLIRYRDQQINVSTTATLACTRGKVEKWHFHNPTDDPHPFHWHLVNAQCGETDETINTNGLKDVVLIPNAGTERSPDTVTQICYVACTPDEFLVEGATRGPAEYNFDTTDPYVAHCHILEHEENSMMAFFKLTEADDDAPNDDGYVAPTNQITSEIIWTAMGMSVLGGISMCFSIIVISIPKLHFLASHTALSVAFALAAGVMVFISLADMIPEAVVYYKAHFTVGGAVDPEAYEYGGSTASAGVCDKTCAGHAWLTTIAAFFGGMVIILVVEYIVHQWLEKKMGAGRHSHGELPPDLSKNLTEDNEKVQAMIQSPVVGSPAHGGDAELGSPRTAESSLMNGTGDAHKDEFKRAGIMTGIAMAIHNFPEGLALFVSSLRVLRTGIVLSIGIILHNIPEGLAVAAPMYYATGSKVEAFKWTIISGIAQPFGAAIGWAAVSGGLSYSLQGTLYGLVAGMLMCITAKELFPGAYRFDPSGKYFVSAFFSGMGIIAFGLILLNYAGSS